MTARPNASQTSFTETCEDPMRPALDHGRASSALAEELLCRLHGLLAEIVVPDAGSAREFGAR